MLEVSFTPFPVLTTERLVLREINHDDAEEMFRYRSDKRIMQFIHRPVMTSPDEAIPYIDKITNNHRNNEGIMWAITLKGEGKLAGTVGFWRMEKEHHRAEIGYMLGSNYQGKGIMQEALQTMIKFGFENMKLHSAEAHVNPVNISSVKVLEKAKLRREAHFKENFCFNGIFSDTYVYCMLASEYFKNKK